MITKVSSYNIGKYNYISSAENKTYTPNFEAVKLYNDRTPYKAFKLKFSYNVRKIKKFFSDFAAKFLDRPVPTADEIKRNNKFIKKIQDKINPYGLPIGEFKTASGDDIIVKQLKNGHKKIDIYFADDEVKNIPYRSAIVDDKGIIQTYNTSYPWRTFTKTDKGYVCYDNIDSYAKDFASDPMFMWESIPR